MSQNEQYQDYLRKGVFAKYKKQTQDAILYLTKAMQIKPEHYESYLQKGITYFGIDEKERAIQYIEEAFEKCSDTMTRSQKHMLNGLLHEMRDRDLKKALAEYEISVILDPRNDFSHNAIGYIEGQYRRAIKSYQKAIECNPKFSSCIMLCNIALCHEKNTALGYYERSIRENREYLEAYIYRSQYLCELEKHDLAIQDLSEVLRIDPFNSMAVALLGDVFYDKGEKKKAHKLYIRANQMDPTNGNFYEVLSCWNYYSFENEGNAIKILEEGLLNCFNPEDVRGLWKQMMRMCTELGRKYRDSHPRKSKLYRRRALKIGRLLKMGPEGIFKTKFKQKLIRSLYNTKIRMFFLERNQLVEIRTLDGYETGYENERVLLDFF